MGSVKFLASLFVCMLCVLQGAYGFSYNEELLVERLSDLNVHFYFQFKSTFSKDILKSTENFHLFPKRFGDIISTFGIDEFHLSQSQGNWNYNEWGLPGSSAPIGLELWAIFNEQMPEKQIDVKWLHSTRAISGLFGLSVNLDKNPTTINPKFSIDSRQYNSSRLRFSSMPNEFICTENFTPFLKLLPCGKSQGLAKLFMNPNKLFDSKYFSTALHFKRVNENSNKETWEMTQSVSIVYNSELFGRQENAESSIWTFKTIFGQSLNGVCPVAHLSNIYFDFGSNGVSNMKPKTVLTYRNRDVLHYNLREILKETSEFNPTVIFKDKSEPKQSVLKIQRYVTDANDRNFGLKALINNTNDHQLSILYLNIIPWYFRVFISSIQVEKENGQNVQPTFVKFSPGLDRKRPHHIELGLILEPMSVYSVNFMLEYAYLKWDEFPPDVNHGFYINPALVNIQLNEKTSTSSKAFQVEQIRSLSYSLIINNLNSSLTTSSLDISKQRLNIYTDALLMNLPTPDFSMPYNVICLTCTVIAIAFGSIHNFTTRKFIFAESKTFKQKLIAFVSKFLKKKQQQKE